MFVHDSAFSKLCYDFIKLELQLIVVLSCLL